MAAKWFIRKLALSALFVGFSFLSHAQPVTSGSVNPNATFVGSEACIDCHKNEVAAWQGSHHDMAMKHADKTSVLGDFDDVRVMHEGKENRFFQKGFYILVDDDLHANTIRNHALQIYACTK